MKTFAQSEALTEAVKNTLTNMLALPSSVAIPLMCALRAGFFQALIEGAELNALPDIAEFLLDDLLSDHGIQNWQRIQILDHVNRELVGFIRGNYDQDWMDAS